MKLEEILKIPSKNFVNVLEDNDFMNKYTEELGEPNIQATGLAPQDSTTPVQEPEQKDQDEMQDHRALIQRAQQILNQKQGLGQSQGTAEVGASGSAEALAGGAGEAAAGAELAELAPLALL